MSEKRSGSQDEGRLPVARSLQRPCPLSAGEDAHTAGSGDGAHSTCFVLFVRFLHLWLPSVAEFSRGGRRGAEQGDGATCAERD